MLTLKGSPQMVTLRDARCMIGRNITYVIPKHYCEKTGLFQIGLPTDIVVYGCNSDPISLSIVESSDVYYVIIPVTEELLCDCDLTLEFISMDLYLTQTGECCKVGRDCKKGWFWITSSTMPFDPIGPCIIADCKKKSPPRYKHRCRRRRCRKRKPCPKPDRCDSPIIEHCKQVCTINDKRCDKTLNKYNMISHFNPIHLTSLCYDN